MGFIIELVNWLKINYVELLSSLGVILLGLQMLVRLTPTKKDDGALEMIGSKLTGLMDMLKIPNVKISEKKADDK